MKKNRAGGGGTEEVRVVKKNKGLQKQIAGLKRIACEDGGGEGGCGMRWEGRREGEGGGGRRGAAAICF